jgi:hypothetical protein
MLLNVQAILR